MAVQFKNEGSKENKKKEKVNKRNETLFPWMDLIKHLSFPDSLHCFLWLKHNLHTYETFKNEINSYEKL